MQHRKARHRASAHRTRTSRAGRSARHARARQSDSEGSLRTSSAVIGACAVATAAGVSGSVAYASGVMSVTLSVDGVSHDVKTRGGTVEDLLERQGIQTGVHDEVSPSPDRALEDGLDVEVRHGRPLDLTVDGQDDSYWVTATRVGPALDQIGRPFPEAELSTSRSTPIGRDGLDLSVKTEKDITLVDGGRTSKEVTTALTAGGALDELGVEYDRNDEIVPGRRADIQDGSRIRLVRVDERRRTVEVAIPNETVVRYDDTMLEGREKVLRAGRDGVRAVKYEVVVADGERSRRTKLAETVRVKPIDRVEVHGTMDPGPSDAPCPTGSSVESGLTANAISVYRGVCAEFPEVTTYYGLRPGDPGEHGTGHALDIMVPSSSVGDEIAAWVQDNYSALGVSEIIWSQQIWTVQRSSEGWRWMEDRGSVTANHYDHVHVTVY